MAFCVAVVLDLFGAQTRRQIVHQMYGWPLHQRFQAGHQHARLQTLAAIVAVVGEQAEFSLTQRA